MTRHDKPAADGRAVGPTFDVCVLGSFMKDLVARAPRRPRVGETIRGEAFDEFLGGKGFNQAVAAARSGARTAMIGRLGLDRYGDEFAAMLADEGIDASHVQRDASHGTGVGLPVVESDGSNSIIIVPRANDAVGVGLVESAAGVIRSSRVLLVQLELPVQSAIAALRIAKAAGVVTVLNPAPYAPLPPGLDALVDVMVPNEVEAEQLSGLACDDGAAPEVARWLCDGLASRGAVLTLGGRGSVVAERAGPEVRIEHLAAHRVAVVDTVAAGDAFCGALAARLAVGDELPAAVWYANAAGALATTRCGTAIAMPHHAEIDTLLASEHEPPPLVPVPHDAPTVVLQPSD